MESDRRPPRSIPSSRIYRRKTTPRSTGPLRRAPLPSFRPGNRYFIGVQIDCKVVKVTADSVPAKSVFAVLVFPDPPSVGPLKAPGRLTPHHSGIVNYKGIDIAPDGRPISIIYRDYIDFYLTSSPTIQTRALRVLTASLLLPERLNKNSRYMGHVYAGCSPFAQGLSCSLSAISSFFFPDGNN